MRPKSSGPALICRRSIARIVPCSTGSSYSRPVRLSTMVSVSATGLAGLATVVGFFVVCAIGCGRARRGRNAVIALQPSTQVGHLAPLAAERAVRRVDRPPAAIYAQRIVGHHRIIA